MPLLKTLSNSERRRFDSPPVFNSEERKKFFNLPGTVKSSLENLRSTENQIFFILQFGYFRSRQRFFAGHFHKTDLEYVSGKFDLPIVSAKNLPYSRSSILRHQKIILDYFGVRFIGKSDEMNLLKEATGLVQTMVRPVKIFWQLVEKLPT